MKTGLVSIVLPIFNVEDYLDRCIESIINQTYKQLEIILVDDGSPDNCPQKCDEWAKKDIRIKVIHKKNEGLGYARNTGIENASGEYICFFDSDDYIALDTIEKVIRLAKETTADVVTFGYSHVDYCGKIDKSYVPETVKNTFRGDEIEKDFLMDMLGETRTSKNKMLHMSAWASMYSMKLIKDNNWSFISERDVIAEDVYSLLVLYKYVKCVTVLHEPLYFYCDNDTSLTHTYRKDRYKKIKEFYIKSKDKAIELNYSANIVERLKMPYFSFVIAALKMIVQADCGFFEKRRYIKEIIYDDIFRRLLKEMKLKEETFSRRILWIIMKLRLIDICYILVLLKNK